MLTLKPKSHDSTAPEVPRNYISPQLAILIVLFTFLIFANTINHYFVLDDFEVLYSVKYNKLMHVLLGYDTVMENKFLRPVPMFFFWLQFKLFGLAPAAFHTTTLLLHALCAILAANLFYVLFKNYRAAAILGFVFVLFPNHSEVVNWPSINFTSWNTLFYLGTLNLFAYYRLSSRKSLFALSLFTFVAALFSKESAFTLPVSLVVLDFFFSRTRQITLPVRKRLADNPSHGRGGDYPKNHGQRFSGRGLATFPTAKRAFTGSLARLKDHAIYFGLFALVLLLTRVFFGTGVGYPTVEGENLVSLYLGNIYVLAADIIRMNLIAWKYLFAPISPEIGSSKEFIFGILFLLIFSSGLFAWTRRINVWALAYCFLFVSVTWLPVLGTFRVLPITQWIRFLYLPSVAACYIISMLLDGLLTWTKKPLMRYALLAVALIPMLILTKFYDNQWIKAEDDNRKTMDGLVEGVRTLPRFSRVYVSGVPWSEGDIPRIAYALPGAIGLYCDRKYFEGALNFLPANKILALDRERQPEQDWRCFRMNWDENAERLDAITPLRLEAGGDRRSYTWDFSRYMNQSALEPAADIAPVLSPGTRYPAFMVDGPWAVLWLPEIGLRRPIKYLTLEMTVKTKRAKRDIARVFWVSEGESKITGGRSIGFFTRADGEFHEYKIPLYRNGLSLTNPRILRFAIRPSQERGAIFSIREMTIDYY